MREFRKQRKKSVSAKVTVLSIRFVGSHEFWGFEKEAKLKHTQRNWNLSLVCFWCCWHVCNSNTRIQKMINIVIHHIKKSKERLKRSRRRKISFFKLRKKCNSILFHLFNIWLILISKWLFEGTVLTYKTQFEGTVPTNKTLLQGI